MYIIMPQLIMLQSVSHERYILKIYIIIIAV